MAAKKLFPALVAFLALLTVAAAETTCYPAMPGECKILITVDIAFAYNPNQVSWGTINDWMEEAEDVWNGDGQKYGECECDVEFQINAINVTDPAQINCNPGPPGYHCIMVTDFNQNPPKDTNGTTYRAYMYGVTQKGQSSKGWWSTAVGTPHPDSPTGQNALDAAHEVGHMLGLDDDYDKGPPERHGNNIMGTTHGEDAKPTQEQIDKVVEKNCGEGACPDECCCGNGEVEDDKGETCEPFLDPTGCPEGTYCCKICCNCHDQLCAPEVGSYATSEDCDKACRDGSCYFNYETGCWDCVKHEVVETPSPGKSLTQIIMEIISRAVSLILQSTGPATPGPEPAVDPEEFILMIEEPEEGPLCGNGMCEEGEWCGNCDDCDCGDEHCNPWEEGADGAGCFESSCPRALVAEDEPEPVRCEPSTITVIDTTPPDIDACSWQDPVTGTWVAGYTSQSGCEAECTGQDDQCLLNYQTMCWDCVHYELPGGGFVCGNGICETSKGEHCGECGRDCDCGSGHYCDPEDSGADDRGCVTGQCVCGKGIDTCGEHETCRGGVCDCGSGSRCYPVDVRADEWGCVPEPPGGSEGSSCSCDEDCESGLECVDGECFDCTFGRAEEGCSCDRDSDCASRLECDNDVCVPEEQPVCGDGSCDSGEDCEDCGADCGCGSGWVCDPDDPSADSRGCVEIGYCGDGMCDPASGETCECVDCWDACPDGLYCNPSAPDADLLGCSATPPGGAVCGNGMCEETEYCYTCWEDCPCPDGTCCDSRHGGIGCGTAYCGLVDSPY